MQFKRTVMRGYRRRYLLIEETILQVLIGALAVALIGSLMLLFVIMTGGL